MEEMLLWQPRGLKKQYGEVRSLKKVALLLDLYAVQTKESNMSPRGTHCYPRENLSWLQGRIGRPGD